MRKTLVSSKTECKQANDFIVVNRD